MKKRRYWPCLICRTYIQPLAHDINDFDDNVRTVNLHETDTV